MDSDLLKTLATVGTIVALAFGGFFAIDKLYARDIKVEQIYQFAQVTNKQLQLKVQGDILEGKQQRYIQFVDKYGPNGERAPSPEIKGMMQDMQKDISKQSGTVAIIEKELGKSVFQASPPQ